MGHSNTVDDIVNKLCGEIKIPKDLPDTEYDNLYIVTKKGNRMKFENKTYGICRVTGKLISKERLRSVPHATLSIDAKLEQTT